MKNLFYTFLSFLFFISFQNPNLKDLKKEKFIILDINLSKKDKSATKLRPM